MFVYIIINIYFCFNWQYKTINKKKGIKKWKNIIVLRLLIYSKKHL